LNKEFEICFPLRHDQITNEVGTKLVPDLSQICPKSVSSSVFFYLLDVLQEQAAIGKLKEVAEQTNRTLSCNAILRPLLDVEVLEMSIPEKPTSSKNKYMLKDKGRTFLEMNEG
jgi:ATP-dependent DNA helicase RecG